MDLGQAWKEKGLSPLSPQQLLGHPPPSVSLGFAKECSFAHSGPGFKYLLHLFPALLAV